MEAEASEAEALLLLLMDIINYLESVGNFRKSVKEGDFYDDI